jgi:hypothetical protein
VSPGPDFRELVGDDLPAEELARLRRVHDLLVAAGPPPDLSPTLATSPSPPSATVTSLFSKRRRRVAFLLAAGVAAALFGGGYLVGAKGNDSRGRQVFGTERVVRLGGNPALREATVVVRVGKRDGTGNLPMLVTAEGLRHLPTNDYYTLFMTRHGKRLVVCGSFNVDGGNKQTTVRLTVGYTLHGFDGFALTQYQHRGHKERQLLTGSL